MFCLLAMIRCKVKYSITPRSDESGSLVVVNGSAVQYGTGNRMWFRKACRGDEMTEMGFSDTVVSRSSLRGQVISEAARHASHRLENAML